MLKGGDGVQQPIRVFWGYASNGTFAWLGHASSDTGTWQGAGNK